MKNINEILDTIKEKILEKISQDKESGIEEIQFCIDYFMDLKNEYKINNYCKGLFFEKDEYLESHNINKIIGEIIENIKNKFGEYVIDELAVVKYNGNIITPIYFYSLNKERLLKGNEDNLKKSLINDFKFYTGNILQDDLLEDGEGTLAGNQTGSSFDIILRIGDYIFGFNNSKLSIDEIQNNLSISKNDLISEVSKLYNYMK
ncbi:MAG: hypothetical protein V3575_04655 [Candidatus Absconditabacteria bacterium]